MVSSRLQMFLPSFVPPRIGLTANSLLVRCGSLLVDCDQFSCYVLVKYVLNSFLKIGIRYAGIRCNVEPQGSLGSSISSLISPDTNVRRNPTKLDTFMTHLYLVNSLKNL